MKKTRDNTCSSAGSNINPMNDDHHTKYESKPGVPANTSKTRRAILRTAGALGLASIEPGLVMASSPPPSNPPLTLEQRIERTAAFIFTGTFRRFLYVPEEAYKNYLGARRVDADYLRLENYSATEDDYRRYYESRPVDTEAFRLRPEGEISGGAMTFLEFEINKVLFVKANPVIQRMGIPKEHVYFSFGSRNQAKRQVIPDWQQYLGKPVIMFSSGTNSPVYIPYPYSVHSLPGGGHSLDVLPLPLSDLSKVTEIAQRLGMARVDK